MSEVKLSPETIQDLVDAMGRGGKYTGGGGDGDGGYKVNFRQFGKGLEGFGDILEKGGGNLKDLFKATGDTAGAFSGLAETIFGGMGAVASYFESTQKTFQGLAKVGGGLAGNLGDLRFQAARTRLPLDQFANLIDKNSTQLAGFAGGVAGGTKQFAALSQQMFEGGVIDGFMNLGYSIEEANEFVIKNTALQRREARLKGMSDQEQLLAAEELAKNMSVVAKLTGKDAKAQQDELIARQRNGATQARLRLLEMDGVTGAQGAYNAAQSALEKAPDVVQDLVDDLIQTGVPMTEATKNFAATNREAYQLAQQAAAAVKSGDREKAEALANRAAEATARFASSRQGLQLATLAQVSDVAQGQASVLEETGPLIDAIQDTAGKLKASATEFSAAFDKLLGDLQGTVERQTSGTAVGQDALVAVNEGQQALANTASAINGSVAGIVKDNQLITESFKAIGQTIEEMFDPIKMREIQESVIAGAPGSLEKRLKALEESGGIDPEQAKIAKKEAEIMLDPNASEAEKSAARDRLEEAVGVKILEIDTKAAEQFAKGFTIDPSDIDTENEASFGDFLKRFFGNRQDKAMGGTFNIGDMLRVGEQGPETIFAGLDGTVVPNMKNAVNRIAESMNRGDNPSNAIAQAVSSINPSVDSSQLAEKLDNLNAALLQLVNINTDTNNISQKQVRAVKAAGNLMSGVSIR